MLMCMPMRPNKAETAVHGCHHLGQEPIGLLPGWYGCAYARPWVGVWACHLLLLFEKSYLSCRLCQMCVNSHNKNRITHPLRFAKNGTTHPLPRVQKLMTHPLSAPAHLPLHFLTSPLAGPFCPNNWADHGLILFFSRLHPYPVFRCRY